MSTGRSFNGSDKPLAGYVRALATYAAAVAGAVGVGRLRGARLPDRFTLAETVLLVVATHRGSRMLTKDAVLSPLRAPFTRHEGPAGAGEVNEVVAPTASAHVHAVGELLTCPFCAAVWTATALLACHVVAPRPARLVTTGLTVVAGADALHLLYDALKEHVES
ncbi:DUF1360 domain-containing protein [Actinokineospora auranticolor]|uniref:Uncharacterized protein DUF1360 n=1 Tax=Actinokineospora auranticolor TaxID=155976 RepID=A0A2S6GLM4_9PSEU|nr:DUF1360 domain-containing protein [Actinokineospora auranticolor]PPK66127.1 uncharacterized protein DUF1360 [Actinokineospora auranticolor]